MQELWEQEDRKQAEKQPLPQQRQASWKYSQIQPWGAKRP